MAAAPEPQHARRRLRTELREARKRAALTQQQAASALDWSPAKIRRIETGASGVTMTDLRALLARYDVADPEDVARITELARAARAAPWWRRYRSLIDPLTAQYLELESSADSICLFHTVVVPGLLQTQRYSQAIIENFRSPDEVEMLAELRTARRARAFGEQDRPGKVAAVLTEGALRTRVGGAAVMREQLLELARLAKTETLEINILPFSGGAHPGMRGPFTVLGFEGGDGDAVALETTLGLTLLRGNRGDAAKYLDMFERLVAKSVRGDEAVDFLERTMRELG